MHSYNICVIRKALFKLNSCSQRVFESLTASLRKVVTSGGAEKTGTNGASTKTAVIACCQGSCFRTGSVYASFF